MIDYKIKGLTGICAVLQTVFALCYYADPCPDNKCATKIATWNPWYVWIPSGVGASICIGNYIQRRRVPPNTFYKIEPLTVSPLGGV